MYYHYSIVHNSLTVLKSLCSECLSLDAPSTLAITALPILYIDVLRLESQLVAFSNWVCLQSKMYVCFLHVCPRLNDSTLSNVCTSVQPFT